MDKKLKKFYKERISYKIQKKRKYLYKFQQIQNMIIGVGSILVTVGLMIYDISKKNKLDKQGKNKVKKPQVIRICLTGGPCGGKSQGINMIYHSLKNITVPVFIVPQAATIIGSAGLDLSFPSFTPREIELFQIYLMRLQFNLQNLMVDIAKMSERQKKRSVVLCDRGMLDGKAYAGDENWAKMLQQIKITEQEILQRYQAVIHMVTAAEGAEEHYNLDNAVRKQNAQFAVQLDRKIQKCYKDHPNRYLITNQFIVSNWQQKKRVLLAQVYQILIKLIQQNNIITYYQDYLKKMRKQSQDDIDSAINPYMLRKIKYKKFMKKDAK